MPRLTPMRDQEQQAANSGGQSWLVSWHGPDDTPQGKDHGAAGICVGEPGRLALISEDGIHWGFPAGRPELGESPLDTLVREVWEEACVRVLDARLLGFSRSQCVAGHENGLVLIRSHWYADVTIEPWRPEFEIAHRRLVPAGDAGTYLRDPNDAATRISLRALAEAGLI